MPDIHSQISERVRWVFGDMAEKILKIEQQRLGLKPGQKLSPEDLERLASDLRELSEKMAGSELAERVYDAVHALARGDDPDGKKGEA